MVDQIIARIAHLVFAALWAGSVFYVTMVVLPLARDGAFTQSEALSVITAKLATISRVSAVVLFATGGHLAGTGYSIGGDRPDLFTSTNGQLVVAMVVFWLALTVLVEVGTKRLRGGLGQQKLREPAYDALPFFRAATVVAVGLLVIAGLITTNAIGRLL